MLPPAQPRLAQALLVFFHFHCHFSSFFCSFMARTKQTAIQATGSIGNHIRGWFSGLMGRRPPNGGPPHNRRWGEFEGRLLTGRSFLAFTILPSCPMCCANTNLCAIHAKRVTIMPKDMQLANNKRRAAIMGRLPDPCHSHTQVRHRSTAIDAATALGTATAGARTRTAHPQMAWGFAPCTATTTRNQRPRH